MSQPLESTVPDCALADTHLGLPAPLWSRHVPVAASGTDGRVRQLVFNRRAVRQAVIPAATVSSTARDLARFYQMLLQGGELDGARILAPPTVAQACRPSADGRTDQFLGLPIRWSQGFQLGGPVAGSTRPRPMGCLSSPATFGHNGSNCCLDWADPTRGLVLAYLTNRLTAGLEAPCIRARSATPCSPVPDKPGSRPASFAEPA